MHVQVNDDAPTDTTRVSHFKVSYQQVSCTSTGINCIGDLIIVIDSTDIVLGHDGSVLIDNQEYENLDALPYSKGNIIVKQVTQQDFVVETTGFVVTYNADGSIYITAEPYYSDMVR